MSHPTSTQPVLDLAEPSESVPESVALLFALGQNLTETALQTEMQASADGLMAALFTDVEQMLERGVAPIVEPAPPAPQPAVSPEAFGTHVVPLAAILPPKLSPRDLVPQPDLPDLEPEPEPVTTAPKTGKTGFWLALLCSSLLLSAGLLSYLHRAQVSQFWLHLLEQYWPEEAASAPTVAAPSPSPENADFLQYLSRSMERLSRQAKLEPAPSPSPSASPSPTAAPSVIERIYVPIYPTTSTAQPSPAPATRPAAPAARPSAPAQPKPAPVASSPVPNIAAADHHTLLGVLELGDRSAALFEVNGIPQRIEMG